MNSFREWCREQPNGYSSPVLPGDGERIPGTGAASHVVRGGNFSVGDEFVPYVTRASVRWTEAPDNAKANLGVRLARPVRN